ncbi:MAG: response regulator transcription factor [Blastocatellia bacterium]
MSKAKNSIEATAVTPARAANGKILVIEADADMQKEITGHFQKLGYDVITAADGEAGVRAALEDKPDALILDVMLPGTDGFSICRHIRERNPGLPILILTSRDDLVDKVLGLEMGADHYLTKPFNPRELEARVKSVLRRARIKTMESAAAGEPMIVRGALRVNLTRREVTVDGRYIDLTPKEFQLLALFASHPGRVYSRKFLLENIWDYTYSGFDRTVDSHINRLRTKIEEDTEHPQYIMTVWGVGYKFYDENDPD